MHGMNKERERTMDKVRRCLSEIDRLNLRIDELENQLVPKRAWDMQLRIDELEKLLAHANTLLTVERATTDTILDRIENSTNS